jgi:hypothetical protein
MVSVPLSDAAGNYTTDGHETQALRPRARVPARRRRRAHSARSRPRPPANPPIDACHGPGFCYLRGHGVPAALDAAIMSEARDFFALPESDKRALAIAKSPHF